MMLMMWDLGRAVGPLVRRGLRDFDVQSCKKTSTPWCGGRQVRFIKDKVIFQLSLLHLRRPGGCHPFLVQL